MLCSFYQNPPKEYFAIDQYVFHSFRFGICWICSPNFRGEHMKEQLHLKNHLKEVRTAANLSQAQLAEMVGVSRKTISSNETGQFNPPA